MCHFGFSILIGSSGGSSPLQTHPPRGYPFVFQYPHRIVGGFKLIGKRPGDLPPTFQYPHRIVGGFKLHPLPQTDHNFYVSVSSSDRRGVQVREEKFRLKVKLSFSILIGSSGGSSWVHVDCPTGNALFQYPHRIVGGFKVDRAIDFAPTPTTFQYPHRIVGGFKFDRQTSNGQSCCVSVSSSDRRGVQANIGRFAPSYVSGFSILIGSSGGSRTL